MWINSLKNLQSDNNKILYETLLDFFYSETVLTFWISLVESDGNGAQFQLVDVNTQFPNNF
jgi:hypothetical protein